MKGAVLTFAFALSSVLAGAPATETLLDQGYRQMYNLQFSEAHRTFGEWSREHPDDAMGPVSDAAAWLFAEFNRLHILESELFVDDHYFRNGERPAPDPALKQRFERALEASSQIADRALARNPRDTNALLAQVLRLGLHADYLALIEKRYLASLREMKEARNRALHLIAMAPQSFDAYLALGAENYILSQKPAPVRWLLRLGGAQTDKAEGIRELQITAMKGRFLMPYARLLLAVAALRDHDGDRAAGLLRGLATEFPQNPLYAKELARLGRVS